MKNKEKIKYIDSAINRITNKSSKIYFYLVNYGDNKGSVLTTYKYATYLKKNGYNVTIIHNDGSYKKPEWIGDYYLDVDHEALDSGKVKVNIDDVIVYPETHPDVMEKTKKINCTKIVLCQSHKNMLAPLPPNINWTLLDIDFTITVSENMKKYIKETFHIDDFFIKVIEPSIDEEIFYIDNNTYREPVIPVVSRNQSDILELAKQFYSRYPEYKMVSFKDMRGFSIDDFATTLNESFLAIWLDRDASFGQFPIECLKCNLPVIALKTDMDLPYDFDNIKWVNSTMDIPKMVFERVVDYLNDLNVHDYEDNDIYTTYNESNKVISTFNYFFTKKLTELENLKKKI